jgi:hypothetical protein
MARPFYPCFAPEASAHAKARTRASSTLATPSSGNASRTGLMNDMLGTTGLYTP